MITWEIEDGDLQIGSQGFASLTGQAKVQQDLYCATAEPYGSDPYHPGWGCLLGNYIGSVIDDASESLVSSEVSRVVNNYMLVQQSIMQTLANAGLANQYNTSDIVSGITSLNVSQSTTSVNVDVEIATQDGSTVSVTTTASTS